MTAMRETTKEGKARSRRGKPQDGSRASSLLRTSEVLKMTGITHQVLYRYVTLGLLEPAATTTSGQRLFHPNVVDLIDVIKSLKQSGYSLRDMKTIFFKDERVKKAMARQAEINA